MKNSLLATMLLCWAAAVAAQTAYKYQKPDGSFVYSDKPVPGAKLIDQIPLDRVQTVPAQGARPAQPSPQGAAPEQSRNAAIAAADAELEAAQQAVAEAKERLEKGTEPLPGERTGNANGTSRLSEAYFERMQQLEQDLKNATARLDQAYQKRNDAR